MCYKINSLHVEFTDVNSTLNVQFVTEIDFKSEYNNPSSLQYKSLKKDIQIQVSRYMYSIASFDIAWKLHYLYMLIENSMQIWIHACNFYISVFVVWKRLQQHERSVICSDSKDKVRKLKNFLHGLFVPLIS